VTNRLFRKVVGWLHARFRQKREVVVRLAASEPRGQGQSLAQPGRAARLCQEPATDRIHPAGKTLGRSLVPPMQRVEELSQPAQQFFAPTSQAHIGLLGQKPHVADQVGHAKTPIPILNPRERLPAGRNWTFSTGPTDC